MTTMQKADPVAQMGHLADPETGPRRVHAPGFTAALTAEKPRLVTYGCVISPRQSPRVTQAMRRSVSGIEREQGDLRRARPHANARALRDRLTRR